LFGVAHKQKGFLGFFWTLKIATSRRIRIEDDESPRFYG
jgi:hypothetical protein